MPSPKGALLIANIPEKTSRVILGIILAAFAFAAAVGMTADLPFSRAATETEQVLFALKFGSGDFNPHLFIHPPLFAYVLFAFYGLSFALGRATGFFQSLGDFERLVFTDQTLFYLVARGLVLILAVTGAFIFYRLAKRLGASALEALLSCALLCSSLIFVSSAHYATTDIPMVTLSLLAFFTFSRLLAEDEASLYAWGGFLIGLASAAKYLAVFLFIPMAAAHVLGSRARKRAWSEILLSKKILLAGALSALGFIIGCPFALLDAKTFIQSIAYTRWTVYSPDYHFAAFQAELPGWLYMTRRVFPQMMGWPLTVFSGAGLLYGLWRRQAADLVLASWIIPYSIMLARASMMQPQYFLHVLPFMILMGVRMLADRINRLPSQNLKLGSFVLTAGLLAYPSLKSVWLLDTLLARRPASWHAVQWFSRNIASGTAVATLGGVPLAPNEESIDRELAEIRAKNLGAGVRLRRLKKFAAEMPSVYDIYTNPHPWRNDFEPVKWDYQQLLRKGIQYFILTEEADHYLAEPFKYPIQAKYVKTIRENCRKEWEFRQLYPPLIILRNGGLMTEYIEVYSRPTTAKILNPKR